jgi:hypothetical protein
VSRSDTRRHNGRLVASQEESDAFREVAKAIDFGDHGIHAYVLWSRVMHGEEKYGNFGRELF